MRYTANLWTLDVNGRLVKRNMTVDSYYSLCPYIEGDDDVDEIRCATISDLYTAWKEEKNGDKVCGESRHWKYHFYRHNLYVEKNPISGKPEIVDYKMPGKVYRRGKKVYFKAL